MFPMVSSMRSKKGAEVPLPQKYFVVALPMDSCSGMPSSFVPHVAYSSTNTDTPYGLPASRGFRVISPLRASRHSVSALFHSGASAYPAGQQDPSPILLLCFYYRRSYSQDQWPDHPPPTYHLHANRWVIQSQVQHMHECVYIECAQLPLQHTP